MKYYFAISWIETEYVDICTMKNQMEQKYLTYWYAVLMAGLALFIAVLIKVPPF